MMVTTLMHMTWIYRLRVVNWHSGESVALTCPHKRQREVAELLEAILAKYPAKMGYVSWDNASTHEDHKVEVGLRGVAGRLLLLYLQTYDPWPNPVEILRQHFRHEVT